MTGSEIARTYARTLFDLASAAGAVDEADAGVRAVVDAVRSHIDLRNTLADSGVPVESKREILRGVFGDTVPTEVVAVVTVAVERGNADVLEEVVSMFSDIAEAERGIVVVEVTTAIALDDALRRSVTDKLVAALRRPVTLRERVDASIIGGIVIKVAGRVLDGSISSQLSAVRATLVTASQGGEAHGA